MFASAQQNGLGTKEIAACQRTAGPASVAHSGLLEAGVQLSLSLSANQFHTLFNADNGSSLGRHTKDPNGDMQAAPKTQVPTGLPWSAPPPLTKHLAVPLSQTLR